MGGVEEEKNRRRKRTQMGVGQAEAAGVEGIEDGKGQAREYGRAHESR